MENIKMLNVEIESEVLKTHIEIDNSSAFPDFVAKQGFVSENDKVDATLIIRMDKEGKSLTVSNVSFEGESLKILKNFINQI